VLILLLSVPGALALAGLLKAVTAQQVIFILSALSAVVVVVVVLVQALITLVVRVAQGAGRITAPPQVPVLLIRGGRVGQATAVLLVVVVVVPELLVPTIRLVQAVPGALVCLPP